MKFLVILICLIVNYLWLKDFDRFDDTWFFRFRSRMDKLTASLAGSGPGRLLSLLLIYGIPMIVLLLLLLLIADTAFGVPTMLLHILVLLVAFDRTQPGQLSRDFLEKWREGDDEACALFMQEELGLPEEEVLQSSDEIADYFSKHLIYRCFEKMFVMFFLYMLAGPMGVLFGYISYQLRDSHGEDHAPEQLDIVSRIIMILEWIPMRLLAVTFSLAGNFVQCFDSIKATFWDSGSDSRNAEILYNYSGCALSGMAAGAGQEPENRDYREQKAAEIAALQALLERSQAIWLVVLALITVFGLRI